MERELNNYQEDSGDEDDKKTAAPASAASKSSASKTTVSDSSGYDDYADFDEEDKSNNETEEQRLERRHNLNVEARESLKRLDELSKSEILDEATKKQREQEMKLISERMNKNPLFKKEIEKRKKLDAKKALFLQAKDEEEALKLRVQQMRDDEKKKKDAEIRRTGEIRHKVTQEKKNKK